MHVIAVANQKGGVGKTTTAATLAVLLSRSGRRVHVVDMDPQASLSAAFGQRDEQALLYQALVNRAPLPVLLLASKLTCTPSTIDLARGESQFMAEPGREFILKICLAKSGVKDDALVIVDCPPSLGVLALNCLTAADELIVAVQPGGFELRALRHLQETVAVLQERVNEHLHIRGAVLTNCNLRRSITEQVHQEVGRLYPVLGVVRSDSKLLYATTEGRLLGLKESRALDDYRAVAEKLHLVNEHVAEVA